MREIYTDLRLRGYDYSGIFCGINESDSKGIAGQLQWQNNWVSFIDTIIQFAILGKDSRELYLPTRVERAVFNPIKHLEIVEHSRNVPVYMYKNLNIIRSGGIELRGLKLSLAPRHSSTQHTPVLERYVYVPLKNSERDLENTAETARLNAITIATHLVMENSGGAFKIKVTDVVESKSVKTTLAKTIENLIENEPRLSSEITIVTSQPFIESNSDHLIVAYNVLVRADATNVLNNLKASIRQDGFILLEENICDYDNINTNEQFASLNLTVVSIQRSADKYYVLLRSNIDITTRNKTIIYLTEQNYSYVEQLKSAIATAEKDNTYVYIVAQGEQLGAVGFMKCLKLENGGKFARLFFIQDGDAEEFSFTNRTYEDQLKRDLVFNVYKDGAWGTFRHLQLNCTSSAQVEHAYINALTKGDLSSFAWIESPLTHQTPDLSDNKTDWCTVYYAPINFRDVMLSSGKLAADALPGNLSTQDFVLGLEFAGRDSNGKRRNLIFI